MLDNPQIEGQGTDTWNTAVVIGGILLKYIVNHEGEEVIFIREVLIKSGTTDIGLIA